MQVDLAQWLASHSSAIVFLVRGCQGSGEQGEAYDRGTDKGCGVRRREKAGEGTKL